MFKKDDKLKDRYLYLMEKLSRIDNKVGLDIKAYSYYGGNCAVPCDYKISEECLLKLLQKGFNQNYANTLGYIYYYGRTNNSIPNYEKALEYFIMASINGSIEATYKIADMYKNGYGVTKNEGVVFKTYWRLYNKTSANFGEEKSYSNHADVCIRLGDYYYEKENMVEAARFFLEALYSINLRYDERFDKDLRSGIKNKLNLLYNLHGEELRNHDNLFTVLNLMDAKYAKVISLSPVVIRLYSSEECFVCSVKDMNCDYVDSIDVSFEGTLQKAVFNRIPIQYMKYDIDRNIVLFNDDKVKLKISKGNYHFIYNNELLKINENNTKFKVAICKYSFSSNKTYMFLFDNENDGVEISSEMNWMIKETGQDVLLIDIDEKYAFELPCAIDKMKHVVKR